MNISARAEYGIRAMIEIAKQRRPAKRALIAERQNIPVPFLTQVLRGLVNSGLVISSRGPDGGYVLSRRPESITLLEVVTGLQGPVMPRGCLGAEDPPTCLTGGPDCSLREVWSKLKIANEEVLSGVTLIELIGKSAPETSRSSPREELR
jgi:Rrf2 family transcriptional regulator, cysteine metabolism repressor